MWFVDSIPSVFDGHIYLLIPWIHKRLPERVVIHVPRRTVAALATLLKWFGPSRL